MVSSETGTPQTGVRGLEFGLGLCSCSGLRLKSLPSVEQTPHSKLLQDLPNKKLHGESVGGFTQGFGSRDSGMVEEEEG